MCVCPHVSASAREGQERALELPELELLVVV